MTMDNWQKDLVDYRCALKPSEVKRLRGSTDDWNCRDLKFFIGTVNFDDVDPARRADLNRVETRLALPTKDVDLTIAAGSEALRKDPAFVGVLRSMSGPVATAGRERMLPDEAAPPQPSQLTVID
jgi:NTE family protein